MQLQLFFAVGVITLISLISQVGGWSVVAGITRIYTREQHLLFLISLREPDYNATNGCGPIRRQPGLMYVETIIRTMKEINRNIFSVKRKFNYTIVDTCGNVDALRYQMVRLSTRWIFAVGPQTEYEADLLQKVAYKGVVGFANSVEDINDKGCQSAQFHTVPSSKKQIEAICSVVRHFRWRYVSVIMSDSKVTEVVLAGLESHMKEFNACVSTLVILNGMRSDEKYSKGVRRVLDDSRSSVLLLITNRPDTIETVKALKGENLAKGRLAIIGGPLWGNLYFEDTSLHDIVSGSLVIADHHIPLPGFKDYFTNLTPNFAAPHDYPDFNRTWEATFNCSISPGGPSTRQCNGSERFHEGSGYYELTPLNALTAAISMIVRMRQKRIILKYMRKALLPSQVPTGFNYTDAITGQHFQMNRSTTPKEVSFDILNIHQLSSSMKYVKVGEWDALSGLNISEREIKWPSGLKNAPVSEPVSCKIGHVEYRNESANLQCFYQCISCKPKEKVLNNTCVECPLHFRPTLKRNNCEPLTPTSLHYASREGVACLSASAGGLITTLAVVILYIVFNQSTALRASGRELCYVILFGLGLLFSAPVVFFTDPSPIVCGIQRYIVGMSLTICYAPLFMKILRTYRIFKHTKSLSRLNFVSPSSQVFASIIIIAFQLVVASVWIVQDPPLIEKQDHPNGNDVMVYCQFNLGAIALNLVVCLLLILPCTYMAFKTRNFPLNFNEAKSIGITMYITCMLWSVFLPTYFYSKNSDNFRQTFVLLIFCELFGYVTLIGFFVQKVYRVFHPAAPMTTSKIVSEKSTDVKRHQLNGITSECSTQKTSYESNERISSCDL